MLVPVVRWFFLSCFVQRTTVLHSSWKLGRILSWKLLSVSKKNTPEYYFKDNHSKMSFLNSVQRSVKIRCLENRRAYLLRSFSLLSRIVNSPLFAHDQTVALRRTTRGCDTPAYPRVKITGAWNVRWIRAGARVGFTCVACDSAPRHPNAAVRSHSFLSFVSLFGAP